MDNREGTQPESMKHPGDPQGNGKPSDAIQEGLTPSTAAPVPPDTDIDEPEAEPGFLTPTNVVLLAIMIGLLGFLLYKFRIDEIWNICKAVLGLSFVIFIHELGHFLAAKWCNVHVTTFSIGFGPAIPGCWFKWGETTCKLAVLPLGGYVQMVGQVDGDEQADDEDDPRSYRKKSVGQRMLIISAGVIMNAILAVICFVGVYMIWGREHPVAIVASEDSGGPVFQEGVPTGAEITQIGSIKNPTFTDLKYTVIFSTAGDKIPFVYRLPGKPPVEIEIESHKDKSALMRAIGVQSAGKLQFATKRDTGNGPYYPGTPAADAKFESGDIIVGMSDPYDPAQAKDYRADRVTELPEDPFKPGQRDYFEFARRARLLADKEIVLRVKRAPKEKETLANIEARDVTVAPEYRIDFGARMQMGPIVVVVKNSPADKEVKAPDDEKKLQGDLIESVLVKDADGKEIAFKDKTLDPERLPMQLRNWSAALDEKKYGGERIVKLKLRRHVESSGNQYKTEEVELKWDKSRRFDRVSALSINAPLPIPELGIAYQVKTIVQEPTRGDSPFKAGDVIKNIKIDDEGFEKDSEGSWRKKELDEGQWAHVSSTFTTIPRKMKKLMVKVERADENNKKEIKELEIPVKMDTSWPMEERGWILQADMVRVKASDPWHAVVMGFTDTYHRMMEVFFTIRGIIRRDISVEVIGGPLMIARGAYVFAGLDLGEFLFFLGLISINLAVVNFLPIPVLDGGHMVFLLYEKIRGKPASETVRIWATYAGLALILCLMLFVLYQDINRFFL